MSDADGASTEGLLEAIINAAPDEGKFTLRQFITRKLVRSGEGIWNATQAVAYTEANHKEWDWDAEHSWDEWEQRLRDGRAIRDDT